MPDYRKLHNGHGNSQKLTALSDFEFRVWNQYRATADDFGVCPLLPAKLQGDNRRLATEKPARVLKAMLQLIEAGLVVPFEHQGQTFICSLNWQNFEQVQYPRKSLNPLPTIHVFELMTEETKNLFRKSENFSQSPLGVARATPRTTQTLTETKTLTLVETETQQGEGAGEGPAPDTWLRILDTLAELGTSPQTIALWFRPCALVAEYPDALRVRVPNKLFLEWIPKHYQQQLGEAVQRVVPGKSVRLELAQRRAS